MASFVGIVAIFVYMLLHCSQGESLLYLFTCCCTAVKGNHCYICLHVVALQSRGIKTGFKVNNMHLSNMD